MAVLTRSVFAWASAITKDTHTGGRDAARLLDEALKGNRATAHAFRIAMDDRSLDAEIQPYLMQLLELILPLLTPHRDLPVCFDNTTDGFVGGFAGKKEDIDSDPLAAIMWRIVFVLTHMHSNCELPLLLVHMTRLMATWMFNKICRRRLRHESRNGVVILLKFLSETAGVADETEMTYVLHRRACFSAMHVLAGPMDLLPDDQICACLRHLIATAVFALPEVNPSVTPDNPNILVDAFVALRRWPRRTIPVNADPFYRDIMQAQNELTRTRTCSGFMLTAFLCIDRERPIATQEEPLLPITICADTDFVTLECKMVLIMKIIKACPTIDLFLFYPLLRSAMLNKKAAGVVKALRDASTNTRNFDAVVLSLEKEEQDLWVACLGHLPTIPPTQMPAMGVCALTCEPSPKPMAHFTSDAASPEVAPWALLSCLSDKEPNDLHDPFTRARVSWHDLTQGSAAHPSLRAAANLLGHWFLP